jgi:hypothetical protein
MILLDESFIPCTITQFSACSLKLVYLKPGILSYNFQTIDKNSRIART